MKRTCMRYGTLVMAVGLVVGALVFMNRVPPALGSAEQGDKAVSGPHYTVLETEGHNLVVTDNGTNTLYFYTVDRGQPPGSDLKLRATVDLNQVGKPVIKPKDINIQKK
jgi:hypothetical protein